MDVKISAVFEFKLKLSEILNLNKLRNYFNAFGNRFTETFNKSFLGYQIYNIK